MRWGDWSFLLSTWEKEMAAPDCKAPPALAASLHPHLLHPGHQSQAKIRSLQKAPTAHRLPPSITRGKRRHPRNELSHACSPQTAQMRGVSFFKSSRRASSEKKQPYPGLKQPGKKRITAAPLEKAGAPANPALPQGREVFQLQRGMQTCVSLLESERYDLTAP